MVQNPRLKPRKKTFRNGHFSERWPKRRCDMIAKCEHCGAEFEGVAVTHRGGWVKKKYCSTICRNNEQMLKYLGKKKTIARANVEARANTANVPTK